eukprot:GEMP01013118.1.p1 GENE.GEMP01013118.1~~GEMP01013118.1.p1  ORF type:complete len:481 (+),score=150.75 GEMP01013118.1:266-1708(+)
MWQGFSGSGSENFARKNDLALYHVTALESKLKNAERVAADVTRANEQLTAELETSKRQYADQMALARAQARDADITRSIADINNTLSSRARGKNTRDQGGEGVRSEEQELRRQLDAVLKESATNQLRQRTQLSADENATAKTYVEEMRVESAAALKLRSNLRSLENATEQETAHLRFVIFNLDESVAAESAKALQLRDCITNLEDTVQRKNQEARQTEENLACLELAYSELLPRKFSENGSGTVATDLERKTEVAILTQRLEDKTKQYNTLHSELHAEQQMRTTYMEASTHEASELRAQRATMRTIQSEVEAKEAANQRITFEMQEKDKAIRRLSSKVLKKEQYIITVTAAVEEKEGVIHQLNSDVTQKDGAIGALERQLREHRGVGQESVKTKTFLQRSLEVNQLHRPSVKTLDTAKRAQAGVRSHLQPNTGKTEQNGHNMDRILEAHDQAVERYRIEQDRLMEQLHSLRAPHRLAKNG